ncbi:MAG: peptide-methionine (S)-S-oxide reductase MsrA [Ferruginibacter sp.]
MKAFLFAAISMTLFISCIQSKGSNAENVIITSDIPQTNEAVATFSEGCFWHAEIVFQSLVGVRDAVSGYAGGHTTDPTYEKVASGTTGHAETVNVYYDPSKISYRTLVRAFFASQNPTEINRQGNDEGTEYRSIAFYRSPEEKKIIDEEISKINNSKQYSSKVATEVVPFKKFYKAEDYHQEYISNNPGNGYVQNVSIPDFKKFKATFKEGVFK